MVLAHTEYVETGLLGDYDLLQNLAEASTVADGLSGLRIRIGLGEGRYP